MAKDYADRDGARKAARKAGVEPEMIEVVALPTGRFMWTEKQVEAEQQENDMPDDTQDDATPSQIDGTGPWPEPAGDPDEGQPWAVAEDEGKDQHDETMAEEIAADTVADEAQPEAEAADKVPVEAEAPPADRVVLIIGPSDEDGDYGTSRYDEAARLAPTLAADTNELIRLLDPETRDVIAAFDPPAGEPAEAPVEPETQDEAPDDATQGDEGDEGDDSASPDGDQDEFNATLAVSCTQAMAREIAEMIAKRFDIIVQVGFAGDWPPGFTIDPTDVKRRRPTANDGEKPTRQKIVVPKAPYRPLSERNIDTRAHANAACCRRYAGQLGYDKDQIVIHEIQRERTRYWWELKEGVPLTDAAKAFVAKMKGEAKAAA